jgi:hypothetical protein
MNFFPSYALHAAALLLLLGCSSQPSNDANSVKDAGSMETDLVGDVLSRILKKHGDDVDASTLPKPQQTVLLVEHSYGRIGNGGFQYLFESDLPGDPEYLLTRQAYKTIGATDALAAFEKAFAVFPNSTPPSDIRRRLEIWQSKYVLPKSLMDDSSPDAMYFAAMDGVMEKLKRYVQENEAEFASLPR